MKINYDPTADAMYVNIKEEEVKKTIEMEHFIVDLDKDGYVVGIELLNVSTQQDINKIRESVKNGVPVEIMSGLPLAI